MKIYDAIMGCNMNARNAKKHIKFLQNNYMGEIVESVRGTKIYDVEDCKELIKKHDESNNMRTDDVRFMKMTTTESLFNIKDGGKVAVMNFANFVSPGGGFVIGAYAQEEYLCHTSTLYPVLVSNYEEFYKKNYRLVDNELYVNKLIYSPNIRFFMNGEQCVADVITVAAPCADIAIKYHSKEAIDNAVRDRIKATLQVAKENNIDTIILGAFGCGAFRNDPFETAKAFKEEIVKSDIKNIIFAITPGGSNYEIFYKTIKNREV